MVQMTIFKNQIIKVPNSKSLWILTLNKVIIEGVLTTY